MPQRPNNTPLVKVVQHLGGIEPSCDVGDDPEDEEDRRKGHAEDVVYVFDRETEGHHGDPGKHPVERISCSSEVKRKWYVPHTGEGQIEER